MTQEGEKPITTVFEPWGSLGNLAEHFDCIPHYLFRTSSPRSSGITTKTCVASAAVKHNLNQDDLLSRDGAKAVEMLEDHLLWRNRTTDNLMSWTSSFLFAVQHAIRRQATDRPPSAPESIRIWILDTRRVRRGSFLPAVALLKAYDIESRDKLKHDYYYGEYLSQGRMDLSDPDVMVMTTLKALIDHGLYKLYPPFADERERTRLCRRVLQLRKTFMDGPEVPTGPEIDSACRISVGCFLHIGIRPVIMMILLSLKPRYRLDTKILEAFRENCWGIFVSDDSLECYRTTSKHVPEHRQFAEMMHDVHADTQRERQCKHARVHSSQEKREKLGESVASLSAVMNKLSLTRDPSDPDDYFYCESDTSSEGQTYYLEGEPGWSD